MTDSLRNLVVAWARHPCFWYQFWYPQSGALGGLLLALALAPILDLLGIAPLRMVVIQ